jgi:hypothetical protein
MEQSLHEKLTVAQVLKKFTAFYGTQMFITMYTRTHPKLVSLLRQMNPIHTVTTIASIYLFLSGLLTKSLWFLLFSHACYITPPIWQHVIWCINTTHNTEVLYILVFTFLDRRRQEKMFYTEWQQAFPEYNIL